MTLAMRAARATAPTGERWLRWALTRDGRIEREGRLAPDRGLTLGAEGEVPVASIAGALRVASVEEGAWVLTLDAAWFARVAGERETRERDGKRVVVLGEHGRARIRIGELALLVQVIERPPVRATTSLPRVLRGGFLARTDWAFTSIAAASFFVHFAFVIAVIESDWPIEVGIPDRYVTPIFMEPGPPPQAPQDPMVRNDVSDDTADPEDGSHGDPEDASDSRTDPGPARPRHARRDAPTGDSPSLDPNAAAEEAAMRVRATLGALLGEGGSPLAEVIRTGAPGPRAGDLMADSRTIMEASTENETGLGERGGEPPRGLETLGRLRARTRGQGPLGEGPELVERRVVVRGPRDPEIDDPPPDFEPNELLRAMRQRMHAIQRCYEHELTTGSPDTAGRIMVALRVVPVGTVENVRAVENTTGSETLAACTARSLQTIRLRVGPSEPIDVRYPIVFSR
jgi:hypothetical protein